MKFAAHRSRKVHKYQSFCFLCILKIRTEAVNLLDSMAGFMTQTVKNKSSHNEELVEQVGTALLNGMEFSF